MEKSTIRCLALTICLIAGSAGQASLWGTGSPDWSYGTSGPSPVVFQFDTSTGSVAATYDFSAYNWMWTSGVADSGEYLYVSHNVYDTSAGSNTHDFRIAKVDRATGAVLSDTSISGFLGQTYSQVNALDFINGRLYAIENATSGSTIRGYALEIALNASGDVIGATQGAYVGPYPDAGLDYHDGLWYATSWTESSGGYLGETSNIMTSSDIMNTDFVVAGTAGGVGMIDGLEFDASGDAYAVTWYGPSATSVYGLDSATWLATELFDLSSQLPSDIIQLNGLSSVVPLPGAVLLGVLGLGAAGLKLRRFV